jgi:hypothetical protein
VTRTTFLRSLGGAAFLFLMLLFGLWPAFGWGENGQRLVTNKAVDTLPAEMQPFFSANRQFIVQHVSDPETGTQAAEDLHNHFIQLDHYGQFPFTALPHVYTAASTKFTRRVLETYGLLPWQIGIYSKKLTDAFQAQDWAAAKLAASALAFYVAAAHDPFNTTINNTGSLSGQPGVNERFSIGLVDRYQLFFFVKPDEAEFLRDPTEYAFEMALNAHSSLEGILLADLRSHDGQTSYGDEYYDRFYAKAGAVLVRELSDASTDIGSYWMTAWINAGRPQLPSH